jgi:hypothetical protein
VKDVYEGFLGDVGLTHEIVEILIWNWKESQSTAKFRGSSKMGSEKLHLCSSCFLAPSQENKSNSHALRIIQIIIGRFFFPD